MSSRPLSVHHTQVLELLRREPFLSLAQLQLWLGWRVRRVQTYLTQLRKMGLIQLVHPRHPKIPTTSLWMLTPEGLTAWEIDGAPSQHTERERYPYNRAHLEWLWLRLERVYHIRDFILHLNGKRSDWTLQAWAVEVEAQFLNEDDDDAVSGTPRMGLAQLKNSQGRWVTLAIEYDADLMAVRGE